MISKLIDWCVGNKLLVLLMTAVLAVGGILACVTIKVDAIPDLSDVQVIVATQYDGQSPQIVEDQITYPLSSAMLAMPGAKVVRGFSMFGTSLVYIIFEDGTDIYWARSRVMERLSYVQGQLPAGVTPQLGPDATGVGWIYQYVLTTGKYCPRHTDGIWQDPSTGRWYESDGGVTPEVCGRLVHHRIMPSAMEQCPIDDQPLTNSPATLADLRSIQDWHLRYELTAIDGISEVASIGGVQKQYQVVVDPVRLLAFNMTMQHIRDAIRNANANIGGRVLEISEREYAVQGIGYLGAWESLQGSPEGTSRKELKTERVVADLKKISLGVSSAGWPVYLGDVADVQVGPEMRRGVLEWNGKGETAGGIIVMRFGQNAMKTIQAVKSRLTELQSTLPPGVAIEVAYDRSDLIERAINTLRRTLVEEIIVVAIVVMLFLLHARSSLVAVFVLPLGVLMTVLLMRLLDINANIMSLGGIAIAIGVMVDSSIIMVENAHKAIERRQLAAAGNGSMSHGELIAMAARQVGPSLFFALLIIVVSFLPIFVLGDQSGRLFKPLAYTKTFAMASAAILAVTVIPVLMAIFVHDRGAFCGQTWQRRFLGRLAIVVLPVVAIAAIPIDQLSPYRWYIVIAWPILAILVVLPQKIISETRNPTSRAMEWIYNPAFRFVMNHRWQTVVVALAVMALSVLPIMRLGSEFMPPLEEGDLLYMPTTDPGIGISKARELLQQTDAIIRQTPEVESVLGKAGRAETATDPAPVNMFETTISLKRDKNQWRRRSVGRFYDDWPEWMKKIPRLVWPDLRPITVNELIYGCDLPGGGRMQGLNDMVQIPGLTNSWTMPIRARIDMLSTGIRTPIGIKVLGPDPQKLSDISADIAKILRTDPRTQQLTSSAFAEKTLGGTYLNITINRDEIARYNLSVKDVQDVIATAMGGMTATTTVEGRERYSVNVRYPQELRDNIPVIRQTLVATPSGAQIPLGQLASFSVSQGPDMLRSENSRLANFVFVDVAGVDVGTYIHNAKLAIAGNVSLPEGYSLIWSGQYEYMESARQDLTVAIFLAGVAIIILLYLSTRSWTKVLIIILAVPFSVVGAVWFLWLLDYNISVAVIVGIIALMGLDAETGIVMLLYLDKSYEQFVDEGRMKNAEDLRQAVHDGAVRRIRPKAMTVATAFMGLLPLMWAQGAGADTMRRLAAPMIGGLATSFILELLIYPVIYYLIKRRTLVTRNAD